MVKAVLIFMAAIGPVSALAATPPTRLAPQFEAVKQCRALSDPTARLACYDQSVDVLARATAAQEVVVIDRTEMHAARKGLFGFSLPRIGFLSSRPGNAQDRADESRLEATILSARDLGDGNFRFTIDGGAVWETVEANRMANEPHPGGKVLIERGSLGSFFVQIDGRGRSVHAKRVR